MNTLLRVLPLLLLWCACTDTEPGDSDTSPTFLFLSREGLTGALRDGDAMRRDGDKLQLTNVIDGRDTTLSLRSVRNVVVPTASGGLQLAALSGDRQRLIRLDPQVPALEPEGLTSQPFTYRYLGQRYWASFEPSFTGFPEYTRDGALDFVNRLVDWSGTAPGLEFSEYRLVRDFGQPIVVLSERARGQYLADQIIVVDSAGEGAFRGVVYGSDHPGGTEISFTAIDGLADDYGPESFVSRVNSGYSRSYLLLPRESGPVDPPGDDKRLPRRSFIDPGDLGAISASFLDDGSVMFLSDDHIVLQGSYVLDLDKGLLTVTDDSGAGYRIFVNTETGIEFTLPVSVVQLESGALVGRDNYLRIEVVAG